MVDEILRRDMNRLEILCAHIFIVRKELSFNTYVGQGFWIISYWIFEIQKLKCCFLIFQLNGGSLCGNLVIYCFFYNWGCLFIGNYEHQELCSFEMSIDTLLLTTRFGFSGRFLLGVSSGISVRNLNFPTQRKSWFKDFYRFWSRFQI